MPLSQNIWYCPPLSGHGNVIFTYCTCCESTLIRAGLSTTIGTGGSEICRGVAGKDLGLVEGEVCHLNDENTELEFLTLKSRRLSDDKESSRESKKKRVWENDL
jgi:hypothetical protein